MNRRDFVWMAAAGVLQPSLVCRVARAAAAASAPRHVIDIHAHIISADTARYPITPLDGQRSDWSRERPTGFEEVVAAMDAAGVWKAAIVHSSTTYGYDSSYVADSVATDRKRFAGVFSVDMKADDAVEMIRYWAVARKLHGLRLFAHGSTTANQFAWFTAAKTYQGLEEVQRLGLPVCVSLRMPGVPYLLGMVKQFPKIRFIVDHMIEPPIQEGAPFAGSQYLFEMAKNENIYLKLTSANVRASQAKPGLAEAFFPLLVSKFGASRIGWGSDYPSAKGTMTALVQEAEAALASLTAADREWIFWRTAVSLYPSLTE